MLLEGILFIYLFFKSILGSPHGQIHNRCANALHVSLPGKGVPSKQGLMGRLKYIHILDVWVCTYFSTKILTQCFGKKDLERSHSKISPIFEKHMK